MKLNKTINSQVFFANLLIDRADIYHQNITHQIIKTTCTFIYSPVCGHHHFYVTRPGKSCQYEAHSVILCIFEQLSGIKINFYKSEIFYLGKQRRWKTSINNCLVVRLSLLHSAISESLSTNLKFVIGSWKGKLRKKKLGSWKGKLFSYDRRLVPINVVFTGLSMFRLSFLKSQRGYVKNGLV